jgi:Rieske Fe-S protein
MSDEQSRTVGRRQFFAVCAVGACALAMSSTGCASLATRPVGAVNGVARLALADYPELMRPFGAIKVLPMGERDPLYVLAHGLDRFVALSPICTHRGCTVDAQGEHLVCPCHGSTYDRSGAVLRGPAERPLRRYATQVSGGYIEIDLRAPA